MEPRKFQVDEYKQNVFVSGEEKFDRITFSVFATENVKEMLKGIDEIVARNIGQLLVKKVDVESVRMGFGKGDGKEKMPLPALIEQLHLRPDRLLNRETSCSMPIPYLVDAMTQDHEKMDIYSRIVSSLKAIEDGTAWENAMKRWEKDTEQNHGLSIYTTFNISYDKEKARTVHENALKQIGTMPENWAALFVVPCIAGNGYVGNIGLERIEGGMPQEKESSFLNNISEMLGFKKEKSQDEMEKAAAEKRQKAKSELIELLTKYHGQRLSMDCSNIMGQAIKMQYNGEHHVGPVADIVTNPYNWQDRLILKDP